MERKKILIQADDRERDAEAVQLLRTRPEIEL